MSAHAEAAAIDKQAGARGLLVGIDCHKRFDDRSLLTRRQYREGRFGQFLLGTACLHRTRRASVVLPLGTQAIRPGGHAILAHG